MRQIIYPDLIVPLRQSWVLTSSHEDVKYLARIKYQSRPDHKSQRRMKDSYLFFGLMIA